MNSKFKLGLFVLLGSAVTVSAKAADMKGPNMGIVNFAHIINDSKYGKHEQDAFEALKKQMATLLEDTEKQITDIAHKFNDAEFLDGLSPEGEAELKAKYQTLNEEYGRYQQQYYQVMNQANMRLIQVMTSLIQDSAQKIAKKQKISYVLNKEACFYYDPKYDITGQVIDEMDVAFEKDEKAKKVALNANAQKAPEQPPASENAKK